MTDTPAIGHNVPPSTIFDTINDLYMEAQNWLDGEAIENDDQARDLGALIDGLKAAGKSCEAERKEKVKPLDTAKKAIQDEYNPWLAKAERAIAAANTVRDRWLKAKQAILDEQARIARQKADQERQAALEAMQASRDNLAAREAAEAVVERAKQAEYAALAAAKATPETIGGRKTVTKKWEAVLVDAPAAAFHYWTTRRTEMEAFLLSLATGDVKAGRHEIPGFNVKEVE